MRLRANQAAGARKPCPGDVTGLRPYLARLRRAGECIPTLNNLPVVFKGGADLRRGVPRSLGLLIILSPA